MEHQAIQRLAGVPDAGALRLAVDKRRGRKGMESPYPGIFSFPKVGSILSLRPAVHGYYFLEPKVGKKHIIHVTSVLIYRV